MLNKHNNIFQFPLTILGNRYTEFIYIIGRFRLNYNTIIIYNFIKNIIMNNFA